MGTEDPLRTHPIPMGIPIPTAAVVFGHVSRLDDVTPANMALQLHINYHSTDLLTARGVAHLVVHGTTGSTSYETILYFPVLFCLSVSVK